jgi:hypothetical protein
MLMKYFFYAVDSMPLSRKVAFSMAICFVCFCACIPIQSFSQSTNLAPIRYVQHSDEQRIKAAFLFLEQRVIARDDEYFYTILDSLVEWNSQTKEKYEIVEDIRGIYDCRFQDVTTLAAEFTVRGGDFEPYFRISDMQPQRIVPDLQVGDTLTYRLKINTASDQPPVYSLVTVRKLHKDITLPVVNYKIARFDDAFIEAISSFHHSYIVRYVGDTGGLRSEWLATDSPVKLWDFVEEGARECVETYQARISNNTLQRIPIEISTSEDQFVFPYINSEVAVDNIGFDLADRPTDAYGVFEGSVTNSHTLFLHDYNWNRILIGNLQTGMITSQPFTDSDLNEIGQKFGRLKAFSVIDPENQFADGVRCFAFDADSSKLHTFSLNFNERTALEHRYFRDVPDASFTTIYMGTHRTNSGGPGHAEGGMFVSGKKIDTTFISMGYWGMHRRYIGYVGRCDSTRFYANPIVSFSPHFVGYDNRVARYNRGIEKLGVIHSSTFLISANQSNYSDAGLLKEYLPIMSAMDFKFVGGLRFANLTQVSRLFDGQYLVTDYSRNRIHLFEPYDGKYVCSWGIEEGFDELLSCRQVVDFWEQKSGLPSTYESAIVDLVVLEEWVGSRGLSRFITFPELLSIQRTREGTTVKPDIVNFVVTSRCEMSIALIDAQGNVVSVVEEATLRDPRMYSIAVNNPNRYGILFTIRSADTYNYGSYISPDRVYMLAPDGTVSKQKEAVKSTVASIEKFSLYPNPAKDNTTVNISLSAPGDVSIIIADMLGKVLYKTTRFLSAPGSYNFGFNTRNMSAGRYNILIVTGNTSQSLTMVKV